MTPVIDEPVRRLAATLKGLPPEQDRDPPPGLNLPGHTIQQKLVSPEVIGAHLSITYLDHLKGQVVVDYFVQVLAGELKLLDNLRFIVEQAKKKNPKPMMSMPLVLVECGLRLRELPPDHLHSPDVRRRFDARDTTAGAARAADPYYLAVASHLAAQIAPECRDALAAAGTRQQVKAVLFADAVLALGDAPAARQALASGDSFGASVAAAEALRDLSTPELLQKHLVPFLGGGA